VSTANGCAYLYGNRMWRATFGVLSLKRVKKTSKNLGQIQDLYLYENEILYRAVINTYAATVVDAKNFHLHRREGMLYSLFCSTTELPTLALKSTHQPRRLKFSY
jgi:hypothetical protein